MKHLSVMIKPASSLCNMRCRYCFYADVSDIRKTKSYGLMQNDTADRLIERVYETLADNDAVTFLFQGGEPTLAGISFFSHFCAIVNKQNPRVAVHYALQTNGLLLDDAWYALLKEHGFLVGLSLDCSAALHNAIRVDEKGKGTFQRVLRAKLQLEANQIDTNILCVLTNELARHPNAVWKFLCDYQIGHVQLIPCMGSLDESVQSPYALSPRRFASFYNGLFSAWQNALLTGRYVSVKVFDDILNLMVDGVVSACGLDGRCRPQYIIEADGSVYPCDFYVLDQYCMGDIRKNSLHELYHSQGCNHFLGKKKAAFAVCEGCVYRQFCNGGCKRLSGNMYGSNDRTECGYRAFLDANWNAFLRLADTLNTRNANTEKTHGLH